VSTLILLLVSLAIGVGVEQLAHRTKVRDQRYDPKTRKRRRRRRRTAIAVVVLVLLVALPVVGYVIANDKFQKIARVDVGSHLSSGGHGTNYLLVGTDTRPGFEGSNRSDTILLLHIGKGGAKMVSIPRDLYVTIAGTNTKAKINSAYNKGPGTLIDTIEENLDLPINRFMQINFTEFGGVVDSLGGVTIHFDNPAHDDHSGLYQPKAGDVTLNGDQALAYVRSRYYVETIPGKGDVPQGGLPDINRNARQQAFLRAVLKKAGSSKNPFKLLDVGDAVSKGLKIDNDMTLWQAIVFAWDMGRLNPQSIPLPVVPATADGQSILNLNPTEAPAVLDQFR
jgi:LCP family protein required for cell wall assembly